MKRLATLLLAVLLCLTLALPAMAETSAVLVRNDLGDVRWVFGTNLLRVPGSDGYGMAAIDGTMLTGTLYSDLTGDKGYIKAAQANADPMNAFGVFDARGNIVVPFQYGDIRLESYDWALGVVLTAATADNFDYKSYSGDTFFAIQSVDVYHLPEGQLLATLNRDQFLDAEAVNHYLNIQDRATNVISCYDTAFNQVGTDLKYLNDDTYAPADFSYPSENGQAGIVDAAGNVIMAPTFKYVYDYMRGYFRVYTGEKTGLVDLNGNVAVPAEYDDIKYASYASLDEKGSYKTYVCGGYACVILDGKMGYADVNGNLTCTPTYAVNNFDLNNGMSATLLDLEGKTHIIAADGVETVLEGYEKVYCLDYTGGAFFKVRTEAGYGIIDWHGNVILPCQYTDISTSADGQYVLVGVDYDRSELYQLIYPDAGAAAAVPAPEAPVEEAPAPEAPVEEAPAPEAPVEEAPAPEAPVEEAPAPEAPVEEAPAPEAPAADNSAVIGLLNSAITLLNADASANAGSIVTILNSAVASLGGGNESVAGLLNSAITLLNADAAANASSVVTILNSALSQLQ